MDETTQPPYARKEAEDLLKLYLWELTPEQDQFGRIHKAARVLMQELLALTPPGDASISLKPDDTPRPKEDEPWRFAKMDVKRGSHSSVSIMYDAGDFTVSRRLAPMEWARQEVRIKYDPLTDKFVAADEVELPGGGLGRRSPLALIIEAAWEVSQRTRADD